VSNGSQDVTSGYRLTPLIGREVPVKSAIRYSEAFKLQVLRELEEGRFATRASAARAYGIRGGGTIEYWARRYGKTHLLGKVVRVQKPEERDEVRELKKRVRQLEKALANERMDHVLDEAYLRIACRAAGIKDVEDFKKKNEPKP
jgi:transposase-like protein